MITYKRICIKDYIIKDEGRKLELERGTEYTTSDEKDGNVVVFTNYWATVPVNIFAGEVRST